MARIEIPVAMTRSTIDVGIAPATLAKLNARLSVVLAREPTVAAGKDRGNLTRTVATLFGDPRATKTQVAALGALQPGDPNPLYPLLLDMALDGQRVARRKRSADELAVIASVDNPDWLTLDNLALIVAAGGEVYHEPSVDSYEAMYWWCKVTDPTENLPAFMRPPQKWGDLSQVPTESDGNYVLLQSGGELLPASRIVQLAITQSRTIKTNAELQAMLPKPAPIR